MKWGAIGIIWIERKMKASVGSKIIGRLQGFADALERKEKITDRYTCRKVSLDLKPTAYDRKLVKETRMILGVSQTLFAQFLGVSPKTVRSWEQGANPPMPIACRFMDEIRNAPEYWRKRLSVMTREKHCTS